MLQSTTFASALLLLTVSIGKSQDPQNQIRPLPRLQQTSTPTVRAIIPPPAPLKFVATQEKASDPSSDKSKKSDDDLPAASDDDANQAAEKEKSANDLLIEEREKSVTPFPRPDFSTPSERVVPMLVKPAPDDFKGFATDPSQDLTLPEPRRIFPLPKVDVPAPSLEPLVLDPMWLGNGDASGSIVLPWHEGAPTNSSSFRSLLASGPTIVGPYQGDGGSGPHRRILPLAGPRARMRTNETLENPMVFQPDGPIRERLEQKHWQFQQTDALHALQNHAPIMSNQTCMVPYQPNDFAPVPYEPQPLDAQREVETYYGKLAIDTQRPWVEWWRPFYTGGMYQPGVPVFSDVNLLTPSFLVYGDYRTGVGVHRDNGQNIRNWAHRLNLDMDLRLTGTERFHMFTGPLDHNGRFTKLDFSNNKIEFEEALDMQLDTAFFEGDLGAITGSWIGDDAPFDLPFTCGLVPLLYQNGIWMEDAIAGVAVGAPWKHSRELNWANFDATFFAGFNQVTSPAFNNDNNAGAVYGTAWFIEAYNGYIETDYAYLDDLDGLGRSYHNAAIAYTRRYFGRISNSTRLIGNIGQQGPSVDRTADGALLLFENSLITEQPSTFVPYWNAFVGSGRPQSVARAGNAGGILRNTGINFETDGLTGYPTLNATGSNSYGGAVGLNILSADFRKQWVLEFAALDTYGNPAISAAKGPEYAIGTRYQKALNNRLIWRVDLMNGWFDNAPDIYGTRTEIRWKF